MRHYLGAWKELFNHYMGIWQAVWAKRHLLAHPLRSPQEREFLPAALELEETPVSPLPRAAMWLIASMVLFAILWACLGKLDVVVIATGKIVPSDRTKVIQPLETSAIKAIHVQDGQTVKAGDVLVELDATAAEADVRRTAGDWRASRLACARALTLIKIIQHPALQAIRLQNRDTQVYLEGISAEQMANEERTLTAQVQEFKTNLAKADAEIAKNEAEIAVGREQMSEMQKTLPIVQERARDYKNLFEKDYVSKHEYQDKEKERIALEHGLVTQENRLKELESALQASRQAREALLAETLRATREILIENDRRSLNFQQETIKASQHARYMQLRAPAAGKVQQLAVHTVGGVVTPAQTLMVIVPTGDSVEIEASIQNKDIGFIREGQDAVVKVEAFPYTKYGTVPGKVKFVSLDAVVDEKKGLIFSSRVELLKDSIRVGKKDVRLIPGMAVTIEIKTGQRRVIEYFLSPLLENANESLKER